MSASAKALVIVRQWQSPIEEIRNEPDPLGQRVAVWVLAAILVVALCLTPFISIARVVSSDAGKIVSTEATSTFQALDASIVKSIDVKEGQQVRRGDLLATLDPTFATADAGQLHQQVASLDVQIARAEAELHKQPLVFDAGNVAAQIPYIAIQKALYGQRAAQYASELQSFDSKIASTRATLVKLQGDDARYDQREKISQQVEDMRNTLFKSGASSLLSLLQATDGKLELLGQLEGAHNSLAETQHQLLALQADRDAFVQQRDVATIEELVKAENQRDTALASLSKAAKHQDLVRITAPEDGVILSLAPLSAGSVLKQGDQLMSLVPVNAPVEAEIHIQARDIGFVRPGDPTTLKVDAFSFYEHGQAEGRISWISEGSFTEGDGQVVAPYYKARVAIEQMQFTKVPAFFRLVPGMTLTADVSIGRRSIARYIMGGFVRGAGEPMRGS